MFSTMATLPRTDLHVSRVSMGTGEIGSSLGKEESFALLDLYVELGGNFIDTAHVYADWVPGTKSLSEKCIGEWMKERGSRDNLVLSTKGAHWAIDKPDVPRLASRDIEADLNESLQFLGTDRIDLYWLHRDNPNIPVSDLLETLERAKASGKIRHYAASNWSVSRLEEAERIAGENGWSGFAGDQILWNAGVLAKHPYGDPTVGHMNAERFAFHQKTGMAVLAFQSQAFGYFHRLQNGTLNEMNPGFRGFYRPEETEARYFRIKRIMQKTGLTLTQVLLGCLSSQPHFVTIPIVGSRTEMQLRDSLSALDVHLTPEHVHLITGELGEWG